MARTARPAPGGTRPAWLGIVPLDRCGDPRNPVARVTAEARGSAHVHVRSLPAADLRRHSSGAGPAAARPATEALASPIVTAALVAGLLAGYGIAIPVGAVATYLVSLTARTSLRIGGSAALGIATADGVYALVAALGGAALAATLQPVLAPLRWVSGLVLVVLAVRGTVTGLRQYRERSLTARSTKDPAHPARAYVTLLGITLLNPTTIVYFAALVLGSRSAEAVRPLEQGCSCSRRSSRRRAGNCCSPGVARCWAGS